jgi:hypothetical protein
LGLDIPSIMSQIGYGDGGSAAKVTKAAPEVAGEAKTPAKKSEAVEK